MFILQWNARSLRANKESFERYLNERHVDIVCVCETWFKVNEQLRFKGYKIVHEAREDGKGGVAILVKHALPLKISY